MAYFNAQGQGRVGWRSGVSAAPAPVTVSTLLTSLYSVWNGDTTTSTLDSSIYGAWNGENNANDSVGTNHGTLMNGCTFTTGKIGQAFTFDGVNDYIEYPANSMNLTGDFTISFWGYMRTRDTNVIMSNIGNDGINRGFYIDSDGSYALRFVANYLAPYYSLIKTDNSALFDLNVWNHYTFICKNGVGQWYKNGVANGVSGTVMTNGYITNNKPIIGGYRSGNVGTVGSNKNMALDAFTIWNKAISQDEITQLYNLGTGTQYPFSGQTLPSAKNQFAIDNGTLMNGCTFTGGKIGKAFTFDGVNDCVVLPTNSLKFSGDYSYSFFVSLGSLSPSYQTVLNAYSYYGVNRGYLIRFVSGVLCFDGINGNSLVVRCPSTSVVNTNQWYHFVITKTNNQVKMYMNGILDNTINYTQPIGYNDTTITAIGGCYNYNGSTSVDFISNGSKIDGLSVWQKVLTQAEITELYNSGTGKQLTVATPIVTNGLVLNLDASRLSSYPNVGTTWYDISVNGKNGTMTNGPIFGTANGGQITFDGVNDYIDFGDVLDIGTKSFTINMWVKLNSVSSQTFVSKALAGQQNYRFAVGVGNFGGNNKLSAFLQGNTFGADVTPNGTTSLPLNTWFMATFVFDRSSSISIYYNGTNDTLASNGTISQWNGLDFQSNNPFRIGSYTGADNSTPINFTNGAIGITQMYDRVLSSTEITQNFNATKSRFGL